MAWTVGKTAELAKVSVRTLHHYDEIGLLSPTGRSEAGYRLYAIADLEQLQQILFFRELGFTLEDITRLMADPLFDRRSALEAQRKLLAEKAARTELMLVAIDDALTALEKGAHVSENEMFDVFEEFDPSEYEDEVKQRWGDTEAYRVSTARAKKYRKEDWQRIKAEQDDVLNRFIEAFRAGKSPSDAEVVQIAEDHRLSIDRNFYPLSQEFHCGLGDMYIADPRFTAYYDKHEKGLAQFVCDAIHANADAHSGE